MRRWLIVVAAVFSLSGAAVAFDITNCQPTTLIPDRQVGVLQTDLLGCPAGNYCSSPGNPPCTSSADCPSGSQCSAYPNGFPSTFILGANAVLQLNGHRVTGAIGCGARPCTIQGPGELIGSGVGVGIFGGKLSVQNVDVHGFVAGIQGDDGSPGLRPTYLQGVTSHDNVGPGVRTGWLHASNVVLDNNGGSGAYVKRITGSQVTANNNVGAGIFSNAVRLTSLIATGNAQGGVVSTSASLRDSTVTGNSVAAAANWIQGDPVPAPVPPTVAGAIDIITARRPLLQNSTCDHSLHLVSLCKLGGPCGPVGPWGKLCAGD